MNADIDFSLKVLRSISLQTYFGVFVVNPRATVNTEFYFVM